MEREPPSSSAKRLFALSGIVPLGFFLLQHTWVNARAMRGQSAYVASVESLGRIPLLAVVEIALVFLPLAYHALYGVWMMREGIPKGASPYGNRTLSITNRGAAMVAFVFIVWHVWEFRLQALRGVLAPPAFYTALVWRLSSTWHGFPVRAVLYLTGIFATTFHFAIGTWGYGANTGLWTSAVQRRRAAYGCLALGSVLFIVSAGTVVSLATGAYTAAESPDPPCKK